VNGDAGHVLAALAAEADNAGDNSAVSTVPPFSSLLYREPHLYDLVFPDADDGTGSMVRTAIQRYVPGAPRSLLDVGCGTGRHLEAFVRAIPDCCGIDLLESNIAYAKSVRPGITFHVGDMRTIRHAHAGTLLVLDVLNARAYLEGNGFARRTEGRVDAPHFQATSVSLHHLDRTARRLSRRRTWRITGRADVEDYAEYRLLLPDEIHPLLARGGFRVLGRYDNRQLRPTDLSGRPTATPDVSAMQGRKLYVLAGKE
jgi:SAM-dependent methyltransferase